MSDVVERLLADHPLAIDRGALVGDILPCNLAEEAAALIQSLRTQVAELTEDVALWKREAAERSEGMVQLNLDRAAMGVENMRLLEQFAELTRERQRTLTDPQRLLWQDDVEGICQSIAGCFEHGRPVRCGPCAIKQSEACGVQPDLSLPNLPEVYRLRRENDRLTRERNEAAAKERAAVVAWLCATEFGDDELDAASLVFAQAITTGAHQEQSNG